MGEGGVSVVSDVRGGEGSRKDWIECVVMGVYVVRCGC